jgi:hypothetical protein
MTNEPQDNAATPVAANDAPVVAAVVAEPAAAEADVAAATPDMLNTEIKKAWDKLSDEDVAAYATKPDQFFAAVREKHGTTRDDAQKRLKEIKTACGACTSDKAAA